MPRRLSPLLLYTALMLAFFGATAAGSYVYAHEPPRDALVVRFRSEASGPPTTLSGAVVNVQGDQVTIAGADIGQITVTLPEDVLLEDLVRLEEALESGQQVNVGVEDGVFGQVLTGIVAIEAAP